MDPTLQRHCARYIYVVPDGLRELMSDISREVLRSQPEDMHTFIADYLDALLITRENARVSAKFVEYIAEAAETIVELLQRTGMEREQADKTAEVIQEAFKAWSERKGILKEDDEAIVARIIEEAGLSETQIQTSAVVIQHAFKSFKLRQQRESRLLAGIIDWRVAARSAIKLYRKCGVSPEEAKRAANLIKAAYKGYYTRRAMRRLNEMCKEPEERSDESLKTVSQESDSLLSGEETRKSKGVRIDFASVVPRVDFGDEEVIQRDLESIQEEPSENEEEILRAIVEEPTITNEEAAKQILEEILDSVVAPDDIPDLPHMEERDSETDLFLPESAEEREPEENRPGMAAPSQEQLDSELDEAKQEMKKLKQDRETKSELALQETETAE